MYSDNWIKLEIHVYEFPSLTTYFYDAMCKNVSRHINASERIKFYVLRIIY